MTNEPVAILGAGMMGVAVSAALLRCRRPVLLYDSRPEALREAPDRIREELRLQEASLDPGWLRTVESLEDVFAANRIIETITEKIKAKQKLYRTLQDGVRGEIVPFLFSNTSTISISSLAEVLDPSWQARFCGFHVFHPVRKNALLEIIPGRETAAETVDAASDLARSIDKQPIVVGDGPGFLVNRILNPYLSTALEMLEAGVPLERIERAATNFGMRMGPFRIMDEIGLDVVLHAGWVLLKAFPDRVPQSPLLVERVRRGHLGRKTGRGFMIYPNKNPWDGDGRVDPDLVPEPKEPPALAEGTIAEKLFRAMYEETLRCLAEGIVSDPADADRASVDALGFPPEKEGIVAWGRNLNPR